MENKKQNSINFEYIYENFEELYNEQDYELKIPKTYQIEDLKSGKISDDTSEKLIYKRKKEDLEYTLAIIKPAAIKFVDQIEKAILENGFTILNKKNVHLSLDQAFEFFNDRYYSKSECNEKLMLDMSQAPIWVYFLARQNAIKKLRDLIEKDLKEKFGKDNLVSDDIHGSKYFEDYLSRTINAQEEIKFFFPNEIFEPIETDQSKIEKFMSTKLSILVDGLTELCQTRPKDPIIWLANWLIENNPNVPKYKIKNSE